MSRREGTAMAEGPRDGPGVVRSEETPGALLRDLEREAGRGPVPPEKLLDLARAHGVAPSAVQGLYTFYFDGPEDGGTKVCRGLPCALRGADRTRARLGSEGPVGEASCLGYCSDAPVFRRAGRYYSDGPEGPSEIEGSRLASVEAHVQRLETYRRGGGYGALERFLAEPDASLPIRLLEAAFLRGMGGAGFPVHLKWRAVVAAPAGERYLVVNGHEGEPGTFKDRVLLEAGPHALIEGALIAARCVGATRILLALRREYENARTVVDESLAEFHHYASQHGWDDLPRIEVLPMGGPYVTGEETALLEAIEGRRSEPRIRPPFPAEAGLFGRPTLVQNVETLASIPHLMRQHYGLAEAGPTSKVFCLTGDVDRPGPYREDLGTPAATLIHDRGGTEPGDVKAFFPGGLSGGLLPASSLDVPLDYDAVRKLGAGLGTGAVIPIGSDRCLVDVLRTVAEFFASESCGKCVPCRLGTQRLAALLASLAQGRATEPDLEAGVAMAKVMQETSLCALGQVAGKAYADAMTHFRDELVAHTRGACPVGGAADGGE